MNKQNDDRLSGFKNSYQKKKVLCKSLIDALDENDKKINVDNDLENTLNNDKNKDISTHSDFVSIKSHVDAVRKQFSHAENKTKSLREDPATVAREVPRPTN